MNYNWQAYPELGIRRHNCTETPLHECPRKKYARIRIERSRRRWCLLISLSS
jgi:hypothetical protein